MLVFFYAVLGINSKFAIIPLGKRELVAVYLQSCDCKCSVSLPHVGVGWSAVCDCGIFWTRLRIALSIAACPMLYLTYREQNSL